MHLDSAPLEGRLTGSSREGVGQAAEVGLAYSTLLKLHSRLTSALLKRFGG